MFIAINTIEVPNPEQMAQMFRASAGNMKNLPGFLGLELWTDEKVIKAITRWQDKASFEAYVNSDVFKHSHGGARGEELRDKSQVESYQAEVLI